jgi:ribonucleoside-triphosphate reductase (formate)
MTATKNVCKKCGSENTEGITRIIGYFSKIKEWLPSKRNELKDRQKGDYTIK